MTKKQKKWLIILGIIIAIFAVIGFTFNQIISSTIEGKVRSYLDEHQPLKGYTIDFKKINFNFLNRSVNLIDLTVTPDSLYIDSLVKTKYKSSFFTFELNKLSIIGIDFNELVKNKKVSIRKIRFKKPHFSLYHIQGKKKPEVKKIEKQQKTEKLFSALEDSIRIKGLNGLHIGLIEVRKSEIDILEHPSKKLIIKNDKVELLVKNVALTKSSFNNDYHYPSFENASLTIENNKIKLPNNLYEITFKKFYVNFLDKEATIDKFHYKPIFSRKRFSKHLKYQKDMFDVEIKKIHLSEIDFKQLLISGRLHIAKVDVKEGKIKLFRDKNVPFDHSRRPLLPHQALKKMNFKMRIDTVAITKTYFEYEQSSKKNRKPIHIHMSNINGFLTNINTIKEELNSKSVMKVDLTTYVMDKAYTHLKFEFPLTAKNDVFYFTADIPKPFQLKILNDAVYPAAGMKFSSGTVDKIHLYGTGYPTFAHGRFKMLYHDLKMAALDKDGLSTKKTLSWGINKFVASDNPKKGKEPRVSVMFFERDMEKGFGNFFWKTIYSGMKSTIIPLFQKQSERKFKNFIKAQQEGNNDKKKKK